MGAFKSLYPLPVKAMAAGGNAQIELLGLPLAARVAGFIFDISGTGTAAASTQAVTPVDLVQAMATVDLDSDFAFVRATGRMLHVLDRLMHGYATASSALSVTCTTGGVAVRGMCNLPFVDVRSRSPNDCAIPVRLIREKTINVQFGTLIFDLTNDVTLSAASLRTFAVLVPESGDEVPAKVRIAFEDWSQATANIRPGHFTHLGIYNEATLATTLAEFAQISVALDGQQVIDRISTPELVARYNMQVPRDAAQELSYLPSASNQFLPVICQPDKYKNTQVPYADAAVRADIDSGTSTTPRWFYRQLEGITESTVRDAAMRMGHDPETVKVEVKTDSKQPLQGTAERVVRHTKLLPKRLVRA